MVLPFLRYLIHFSNILFIGCYNILPPAINLVFVTAYIIFFKDDFKKITLPSKKILGFFLLAFVSFSLIKFPPLFIKGPGSIENFDYYKYNYLLDQIFKNFPLTQIYIPDVRHFVSYDRTFAARVIMDSGRNYLLSYYYAIYLPPVLFGWILQALRFNINVLHLQIFFNFWAVLTISAAMTNIYAVKKQKIFVFLFFIFFIGGLDGLMVLLHPEIPADLFLDIQDGGQSGFFIPCRIQDLSGSLQTSPGHLMSALVALFGVILLDNNPDKPTRNFLVAGIALFVFSTSLLAFTSFCLFVLAMYCRKVFFPEGIKNAGFVKRIKKAAGTIKKDEAALLGLVLVFMFVFYSEGRQSSLIKTFVDIEKLKDYGVWKFMLFFLQELTPFVLLAAVLKIRDYRYYLCLLYIVMISLFGSRDLILTSPILMIAYMLYRSAMAFDFKIKSHTAVLLLIMTLYSPSLISNLHVSYRKQLGYRSDMTASDMIGFDPELPYQFKALHTDVYRAFSRNVP